MQPAPWRVPFFLMAAFLLAMLVMIGNAWVADRNTTTVYNAGTWIANSVAVQGRLVDFLRLMLDAETGERGFLLTGDDRYLAPLEKARLEQSSRMQDLHRLTADSPTRQEQLQSIERLAVSKMDQIDRTLRTRRESGLPAALLIVKSDEGKRIMDRLRDLVDQATEEERRLLFERTESLQRANRNATLLSAASTALGLLTLCLFYVLVARHIAARRQSALRLREMNEKLEETVRLRTLQLSNLSRHLLTVREQEKAQIARELHDELGSSLSAIQMDISWTRQHLQEQAPELSAKLARTLDIVDGAVDLKRRIVHDLHPTLLDNLGLGAAVRWHAQEHTARHGLACELDVEEDFANIDESRSIALFRVLQEALTNVAKHAKAGRACVSLRRVGREIVLEVLDDGVGLGHDAPCRAASHGLLGMRERMQQAGGRFSVCSGPDGRGTLVRAAIPV